MVNKVFTDGEGHTLIAYINNKGKCYIEASLDGEPDNIYYSGFVCLDKEDLDELISELKSIRKQMDDV